MSSPSAAPDALAPARGSPARAEDGDRGSDPQKVLADRVEQLYSQMPLGIVFTLVIGAIATYELWDNRTRELVMFWWGLVLLVTAARTALWLGYRKSVNRVSEAKQWLRWLAISALANGANWGFAGAVFFPSHTDEQQVFLAFLLAGIASAGIPTYAASWPMFAMYAGAVVLPFAYVLANSDSVALCADGRFAELAAASLARADCPPLRLRALIGSLAGSATNRR